MVEGAGNTDEPTAAQLAAWAGEQGVSLDEMRARVAGNQPAIAATAARMARMVEEAGTRAAPGPGAAGAGLWPGRGR